MSETRRQKQQQYSLVFGPVRKGEAPTPVAGEAEALPAGRPPESPESTERLMPSACRGLPLRVRLNPPTRRVRTRTPGGVTGTAREGLPMSIGMTRVDVSPEGPLVKNAG